MFEHLIQYARDSWGLLPLLALVFIAGLSVIIERLFFFHRSIRAGLTLEYDLAQVAEGDVQAAQKVQDHYSHTVQGQLVQTALNLAGSPELKMERQIEESIMFQMPKMDRYLWVLDTCVTLGPLLGLLGTIVHLIEAFAVLSASPEHHVGSVTAPIAHALVATAAGLMVAILCVVFLNYFNKRIRLTINQMDLIKSMMVGRFAAPQN
jgi:biopolymer transport protein ExbB